MPTVRPAQVLPWLLVYAKQRGLTLSGLYEEEQTATAARDAFAALKNAQGSKIADAVRMYPNLGGAWVGGRTGEALDLARRERYRSATMLYERCVHDAEEVIARGPYLTRLRANEAALKAGRAIALAVGPDDAETWGERISEALASADGAAEAGRWAQADEALEAALKALRAAEAAPAVTAARRGLQDRRDAARTEMESALSEIPSPPALERLRAAASLEFRLAEEAAVLGIDPNAAAQGEVVNRASCRQRFVDHDWFSLKDQYHAGGLDKDEMWDLWRFRQEYVEALLNRLRGSWPMLLAKAMGSTDLESDIDITLAAPGTVGSEVEAARAFNAAVAADFGKPPGLTFDVNIYIRDYDAIKENFNVDYALEPSVDTDLEAPEGELGSLSRVDQDVATLLKQRRYLTSAAYSALVQALLEGLPDDGVRGETQRRLEEGESLYLTTAIEKVEACLASKAKVVGGLTEERSALAALEERSHAEERRLDAVEELLEFIGYYRAYRADAPEDATPQRMQSFQALVPELLTRLEALRPAVVLETNDALYLNRMEALRKEQAAVRRVEDNQGADEDEVERRRAAIMKGQFEAIVFANEAYMSQGSIQHIVAGVQAKKALPEEAARKLAGLRPSTLLQSFNEQAADFYKDMGAARNELEEASSPLDVRRATGEAFVHAAKYLSRLLDAAQLLTERLSGEGDNPAPSFSLVQSVAERVGGRGPLTEPKHVAALVDGFLLKLRKSAEVPQAVKGELGVEEVERLFGVRDLAGFEDCISAFAMEVNITTRSAERFQEEQRADLEAERAYFGVARMDLSLKRALAAAEAAVSSWKAHPAALLAAGEGQDISGDVREADLGRLKAALEAAREQIALATVRASAHEVDQQRAMLGLEDALAGLERAVRRLRARDAVGHGKGEEGPN